jgi:hypothetical protein
MAAMPTYLRPPSHSAASCGGAPLSISKEYIKNHKRAEPLTWTNRHTTARARQPSRAAATSRA